MRVQIDQGLFADRALHAPLLSLLFGCGFVWQEHHQVVIDPDDGPDWQAWLETLADELREELVYLCEGWATECAAPTTGWTLRVTRARGSWTLPVGSLDVYQALELLSRPFEIHLEDDHNDRAFLLSIAKKEQRQRLERLERLGRVVFFHGGGIGNMLKRVKRLKGTGPVVRRFRIWALFDSDARRPKGPSKMARQLGSAANSTIAGYWRVGRRTIESYLPLAALARWAKGHNRAGLVSAFKDLDVEHQRHFNIKGGLGRDTHTNPRDQEFWAEHQGNHALQQGFGSEPSRLFAGLSRSDYDAEARAEADTKLGELFELL